MTDLTPTSSFDPVVQLETTTLALGGVSGPMNFQAQALVNRTEWLKNQPFRLTPSVTDAPFNASTVGDATAAFQAAYNAAPAGGRIIVPAPGPFTVGTVTGTKVVTWEIQYNIQTNLALLNLPGIVIGTINTAQTLWRNGGANEFSLSRIDRIANYSGGTPGNVCSGIHVYTNVSNNAAVNFEWAGTFVMDNAGQGQNVAVYGQGNRKAVSAVTIGGTFAGVFEARDFTQEANPSTGLIGLEVDVFANDTDTNLRRVGIDLVSGKGVGAGSAAVVGYGLRIGPTGGDPSSSSFTNPIFIYGKKTNGINIQGETTGTSISVSSTGSAFGLAIAGDTSNSQIHLTGTGARGVFIGGTYSSGVALRLTTGNAIALEATDSIKIRHNGTAVEFLNGVTVRQSFSTTTGAISINGSQVVGPRDTGWAAMTGTPNKATVYDVSTITLPQLAARVAALQAERTTAGSIGV